MVERSVLDAKFCALAFKVIYDHQKGPITFFRVYSGQLNLGDSLLNTVSGSKERPTRIVRLFANQELPLSSVQAGDIAAMIGCKNTRTGDTLVLASDNEPLVLEGVRFPKPGFAVCFISSNANCVRIVSSFPLFYCFRQCVSALSNQRQVPTSENLSRVSKLCF